MLMDVDVDMGQVYLGVFTSGVVFIMSSFGGTVALRPPICGDLFGIKVRRSTLHCFGLE